MHLTNIFRATVSRNLSKALLCALALSLYSGFSFNATTCAIGETLSQPSNTTTPQRIVVFPLFAEEMLLEMIGPNRIVGIGHKYFENGEAYSPTMALTEHIQSLTIDDTERMIALKPDLVVLWKTVSNENNYYHEALLPVLEHAEIPVLFVETPTDFDEVKKSLTMLGRVVGAPERTAHMVESFNAQLAQLKQIVSSIPEDKRIRASDYHLYGPTAVYDVIADAAAVITDGGTIFVNRNPDYLEIDPKLLSEWNPDLITFPSYDADTDGSILDVSKEYQEREIAYLQNNPDFSTISAIQNHNIHPLCISESQFMVQSAVGLARLAYPALFREQGD